MEIAESEICTECYRSTYTKIPTIICSICEKWFHFKCAGVTKESPCVKKKDVPYFCLQCRNTEDECNRAEKETNKSTSYTPNNKKRKTSKTAAKPGPIKINISQQNVVINKTMTMNYNANLEDEHEKLKINYAKLEELFANREKMYANREELFANRNIMYAKLKEENEQLKQHIKEITRRDEKLKIINKVMKIENERELHNANKKLKLQENETETLKSEKIILQN